MNRINLSASLATLALLTYGNVAEAQNPIISGQFTADPTARVFEGRLYVFPSHDIPPVEGQRQDWFCMADYHVFSSDDLTHWTDHGRILDQTEVPWGKPDGYSMWAPDCILGKDGRYYFYFPDAPADGRGFGVGVAIADKPYGPYKAEPNRIDGIFGIDPCILQASNGKNYIFWGGGGLRVAQMTDDLLHLHPSVMQNPVEGPNGMKMYGRSIDELPEGFKEGPFAFERNGKYYLTYPWVRNNTETLAYAMADDPMGPYEFKGLIMKESPTGCWTNHHSLVEWKGQWYLFYHHNDYSPAFDKNRSICADSISFNADGTIKEVVPTLRGIGITDASEKVQIDRGKLYNGASIEYNDTVNRFDGWKAILPPGAYIDYYSCSIPAGDYKVWVNTPGRWGRRQLQLIGQTELKLEVIPQSNGLSTLRLINNGKSTAEVDWISLNARQPLDPSTRGGLETGMYRNLFKEAGYDEAAIEARLEEVYNDVFTGPNKVYFEVGKDMAYVSDVKNNDVRTEGMSYGLMVAVQLDKKEVFDRLWRWAKRYMQINDPKNPMNGYFRWSCRIDGSSNANGPASDGELYFITSLLFASNRWGNDTGINYLAEAQHILECIQPRTQTTEKGERTIALMDPDTKLISFVPGMKFTDPSYHLPAFYEVWARYAQDGRASYWRECARLSREYLHKSVHPLTGLTPDYNNFDGSLMHTGQLFGDCFRYDSWRVPMNIALDYSWACADRHWQQNYGHTIQNFLYSEGIDSFPDQYNVDGTRPERLIRSGHFPEKLRHSIGFVATAAAASLLCTHNKSYEFIDRLWNSKHEPEPDGYFDGYYDGLLRLFAFMHLSGHYRVIEKQMLYSDYFEPVTKTSPAAQPDAQGFIRRWTLLDPISKPNNTNTVFTDSYLKEAFSADYSKQIKGLQWHAVDSKLFNVKLFRFASCRDKQIYGVLFLGETIIECDEEIRDVRLAAGSNSASLWKLNGEEVLLLSGDRRMVQDDGVSPRLTLRKGRNVLSCAVINGPGMSDFCVRFLDANGKPVTNYRLLLNNKK